MYLFKVWKKTVFFFFLDRSGSTHTRDDGVVDKRMQGDGRQNGSYR